MPSTSQASQVDGGDRTEIPGWLTNTAIQEAKRGRQTKGMFPTEIKEAIGGALKVELPDGTVQRMLPVR